jgi:3-oxoacyl-[acyl-carrier-protein] synthase-1
MKNSFVCESAHIENLDPAFADLPIARKREEREINCAMSNSFGFGGTNATLAFSKYN